MQKFSRRGKSSRFRKFSTPTQRQSTAVRAAIAAAVFTYYLSTDTSFTHPLAGALSNPGSYTFLANFAGNTDYLATSTTAPFKVTIAVTSFKAAAIHAGKGKTFTGAVATFSAPAGLPATDFTATIDWGDGTTTVASVVVGAKAGQFQINASHTYAAAKSYNMKIMLTPAGTPPLTASGSAVVV